MTTVIEQSEFLEVKNRVYSKLAAALTIGGLSLTVTLADAGLFPDLYPYHLTLEDEIVKVTNRVSNTLTIVRAQQDTSAAAHADKTYVALNVTAKAVSDLNAAVNTIEQALESGINNVIINGTADYLIDMEAGTVNSGGADIRLSNEAKIDNTTAGTLKLMTTASGYVSISEGQIIAKCDYLDLDLDVALRFIGSGKNIDGAVTFRDNVTIGRSAAYVDLIVYGNISIMNVGGIPTIYGTDAYLRIGDAATTSHSLAAEDDLMVTGKLEVDGAVYFDESLSFPNDKGLDFGTNNDAFIIYETADADALCLLMGLPHATEDANNVPVIVFGDKDIFNVDFGFFSGITQPRVAVVDADRDSHVSLGFTDDDDAAIFLGGNTTSLAIIADSAIDSHLLISGTAKLTSGEQALYVNFPAETTATNGIWITLKSTVTSGDLTGVRSRVYGNAASAGANVRGAYLEAKMEASKYVAQLEGALIHADYSAGSVTVSGDVRGLTVHISQGASLNAANLYGILLNMQTRSDETITTDDVGLLIRNEAVGGDGRAMDSAIKIVGLNMGGGTSPFTADITLQSGDTISNTTANNIVFSKGITTGGAAPLGYIRNYFAGTFTSDGSSTIADLVNISGVVVGANGDTNLLAGTNMSTDITTQSNSETIDVIAQLRLDEPQITKGTDTVTVASTLYIIDAPTEGEANAALWINSGDLVMKAGFIDILEIAAPGAGAANTARIYAHEIAGNGGLTELCAVFQDGSIDVFATETTEPDSPIYRYPDNTELKLVMRRPDKKTHQFIAEFPDGTEFVMRELRHPNN